MAAPRTRSTMRSPLGRAIGLGSAKEGVDHWWAERITALALVPLTLWFVIAIVELAGADRAAFAEWVRHPVPAVLLVLLLIATFYHNALGLQVVIEDYVENEALRFGLIIIMKLASVVLAVLGIFAVLKLSFAG
jgi:succinate dehydrogenase / fumarate reductase, membrane anchor subunit